MSQSQSNEAQPNEARATAGAAASGATGAGGTAQRESLILVGVDGSEDGLRAARYAARSLRPGSRVHLVHAVDDAVLAGAWGVVYDPTILEAAGEEANAVAVGVAREAGASADQVSSEVVLGNAAVVLSRMSEHADLMVLGRRSVSGLERMFVGSTSVAAAAASHCPVVVVSQASNPEPTSGRGLVVVGLDAGRHAERTLTWACAEAERRGAHLSVVHVSEPKATGLFGLGRSNDQARAAQVEAARQGVNALVEAAQARHPGLEMNVEIGYGNVVDALAGRSGHAELVVVGMTSSGTTHQVGGTVRGLMAHSQAPVCVIP